MLPLTGDWNGDGANALGSWLPAQGLAAIDSDENYILAPADAQFNFGHHRRRCRNYMSTERIPCTACTPHDRAVQHLSFLLK